jgi:hypothetical protein
MMGLLESDLDGLHQPIDLIIVSDHGMVKTDPNWITLDKFTPLSGFETVGMSLYPPSEAAAEEAYKKLKGADDRFAVYRRKDVPAELHFSTNLREGDPVIVARGPYAIRAHTKSYGGEDHAPSIGNHGFDPHGVPEMKAIFYAEGPDIKPGIELQSFENVNVFPLVVKLLGLDGPLEDGKLEVLSTVLQSK